jgi:hypothetical protein
MEYKGSVHILFVYSYEIVQLYYLYVVRSDISFKAAAATPACTERQTGNSLLVLVKRQEI